MHAVTTGVPLDDPEEALTALIDEHAEPSFWFLRHPMVTAAAARLALRLPQLDHCPGDTPAGRLLEHSFRRDTCGVTTVLHRVVLVQRTPSARGPDDGPNRTSRKKARRALTQGVTFREVTGAEERAELRARAEQYESAHPPETASPVGAGIGDLLEVDHWLLAEHQGVPVLLATTAQDGDWALLTYFRPITETEVASDTRYLMTEALAAALDRRGVRYVAISANPLRLPAGIRSFSRMVGFRMCRVRCTTVRGGS